MSILCQTAYYEERNCPAWGELCGIFRETISKYFSGSELITSQNSPKSYRVNAAPDLAKGLGKEEIAVVSANIISVHVTLEIAR